MWQSRAGWRVPDDRLLPTDPHTLQLTVTCKHDVRGADFVRNFEKAADLLMDLHEAEAAPKPGKL